MLTLKLYGDESADASKSRVFAVAAVGGNEDEWEHGIRGWLRINRGRPFHATDVEHQGPEGQELYKKLAMHLAQSYLVGFAVAVDLKGHTQVFGEGAPRDWAYFKALGDLIGAAARTARTFNALPSEEEDINLEFVFDSRHESNGTATEFYRMFTNQSEWANSGILGAKISFDHTDPRLEMADLLAREAMKELDRKVTDAPREPRRAYLALKETGKFIFIERSDEYWNELKQFVLQPEQIEFAQGFLDWLRKTGRVQNGRPADNMMNWIKFNAWREKRDAFRTGSERLQQ